MELEIGPELEVSLQPQILAMHTYAELYDKGERLHNALAAARELSEINNWHGPTVTMTWGHDTGIPDLQKAGNYPVLVVEFPSFFKAYFESTLAEYESELEIALVNVQRLGRLCLSMQCGSDVIEIFLGQILPLLQLSNAGLLTIALVCGDQVVTTESEFDTVDLLKISTVALKEYKLTQGSSDVGRVPRAFKCSHTVIDGANHWQPTVVIPPFDEHF